MVIVVIKNGMLKWQISQLYKTNLVSEISYADGLLNINVHPRSKEYHPGSPFPFAASKPWLPHARRVI